MLKEMNSEVSYSYPLSMVRTYYWFATMAATTLAITFIIRNCFKVISSISLIKTRFVFIQIIAAVFSRIQLTIMIMVKKFLFIKFGSMIRVEIKTPVLQTKWFITMQIKLAVIKIQD